MDTVNAGVGLPLTAAVVDDQRRRWALLRQFEPVTKLSWAQAEIKRQA